METRRQHKSALGKAALALQLALVLLITYWLVRAVIAFITPQSLWTLPTANAGNLSASSPQAAQNYNFTFDPFQRGAQAAPVNAGEDAPETTLNLKLFGLRSGAEGTAILQTPDNQQGVYAEGDEIITGVTLKSITPDYIVLSINGRLERLTFDRGAESTLRAPAPPEELKITAESFMREVDIKSVAIDGGGRGYRVSPRFGGAKLSKYGLENGDILLSLGGANLSSGSPDWPNIIKNLSRSGEISAKINRGGKVMTVKAKM